MRNVLATERQHVRLIVVFAAMVLILTGCAAAFERPSDPASYGQAPAWHETTVRAYFERELRIPISSIRKIGPPLRAYANRGLAYGGKVVWAGYLVDVEVLELNGQQSNVRPYIVFFRNHRIVQHMTGTCHVLVHRIDTPVQSDAAETACASYRRPI